LIIKYEDLTSQIDGVEDHFDTTLVFVPGTLAVYLNGVRQRRAGDADFVEDFDSQGFTLTTTPVPGDVLIVTFETSDSAGSLYALVVGSGTP
jgi:hypothetical protein